MLLTRSQTQPYWRTLLVLGRTSNLPTVWSDCLAGWLLGGGGADLAGFFLVCIGATCLYTGGMFLNDAFDVEFDRRHRQERPIPSGAISVDEVWRWGFGLLGGGTVILVLLKPTTGALAAILLFCIVLYDAIHKLTAFAPVLMAACRFFLYLVAASVAINGVAGLVIWSALALAAYIVGLSFLARTESTKGALSYWPCYLLATPIVLGLIVNGPGYQVRALVVSLVVGLWVSRCLTFALWTREPNVGRAVSGLLAGIVLVDLLAVGGGTVWTGLVFVVLFVAALLFQRFIPAT
ncbi:MAG TPA: UbiA family prenyltransferase [Verrucomicrobiae bacterium]|nr:UbiA family prenyltransferase [Verrucomicrobiae bacterium]